MVMGAGEDEGKVADEMAMALGEETPRKTVASTSTLGLKTSGRNTSSAEGRKAEGRGASWKGLSSWPNSYISVGTTR